MINFTITRIVTIAPTKTKREIEVLHECVCMQEHMCHREIFLRIFILIIIMYIERVCIFRNIIISKVVTRLKE